MGHNRDVHDRYYTLPSRVKEVVLLGRVLIGMESGQLHKHTGGKGLDVPGKPSSIKYKLFLAC
jgi:hypothetical protein